MYKKPGTIFVFNILRNSAGINEINVIKSGSPYNVESDQQVGHKALILRSIEAITTKALSVRQDEQWAAEGKKAKSGLILDLTVSPEEDSDIVPLFAGPLKWCCVERLVVITQHKERFKSRVKGKTKGLDAAVKECCEEIDDLCPVTSICFP